MSAPDLSQAVNTTAVARINRRCLIALPFAFAAAAWLALAEPWQAYRKQNQVTVIDAAPHAIANYGGSEWRLIAFDRVAPNAAAPLPPGAARVRARIAVTPHDAAAVAALGHCAVGLFAADDRRWSPIMGDMFAPGALPQRCDGDFKHKPEPGKTLDFENFFVLPDVDVDGVTPRVALDANKPEQLRLRRD